MQAIICIRIPSVKNNMWVVRERQLEGKGLMRHVHDLFKFEIRRMISGYSRNREKQFHLGETELNKVGEDFRSRFSRA